MAFSHYLAFGDSISIDEYAGPGLGAASLLHRNRDDFWPEFKGRDLISTHPGCGYTRLASDGATLPTVWKQLERAPDVQGSVVASLTVGGNDVLAGLGSQGYADRVDTLGRFGSEHITLEVWAESLRGWIAAFRQRYPSSVLVLGTVYDPSDGTGRMQGGSSALAQMLPLLLAVNDLLRGIALTADCRLADIYPQFLGHALSEPAWIYREIEPTQLGSSEVRRLFWNALEAG